MNRLISNHTLTALVLISATLISCGSANNVEPVLNLPVPLCDKKPSPATAESFIIDDRGGLTFKQQFGTVSCLKLANGEASSYVLLRLPTFQAPYMIAVNSHILPGDMVMPPIVETFDKNMQKQRTFQRDNFSFRGSRLSTHVFINPENAKERYLMLRSDPSIVGSEEVRVTQGSSTTTTSTGAVVVSWTSGFDATSQLKYTHNGRMSLIAAPPEPQNQ